VKRSLHLLWIAPLLLFGFLFVRADFDLRYLVRVLYHRDSSTSDYRWKASRDIAASAHPRPWPTRPCPPGVIAPDELERGGVLAFVAIKDGALACEWYGNGGARDRPAAAFSISKIVTALVLARAVDAHAARYDDPITRYIPELAERDPRFTHITLASLVDMRSGLAFDDDTRFPWVDGDSPAVYYATDLAHTVVTKTQIAAPPNTTFLYNDYAPNLVGLALQRAGVDPLTAIRAIWNELGAEYPAQWSVDDRGFPWLESGFVTTARDLARIGELLLDAPSSTYVARTREPTPIATSFAGTALGYHDAWWRLGTDLVAMGRHGQIMVVDPTTHVVLVRLGLDGHAETNVAIARHLAAIAAAM
jgi:CubicO group peptidase (beta-lactamase class C family)